MLNLMSALTPTQAGWAGHPLSLGTALVMPDTLLTTSCAEMFALPAGATRDNLEVMPGCQVALSTAGSAASAVAPHVAVTRDPARFKEWIGVDDTTAAKMTSTSRVPLPNELPTRHRDTPLLRLPRELRPQVMAATWHYLFRDSRTVATYHRQIAELAPFEVAVFAIRRLVVGPASSLVISGLPARLVVDELVLHPGGAVQTFTITKGIIGRLEKLADAPQGAAS